MSCIYVVIVYNRTTESIASKYLLIFLFTGTHLRVCVLFNDVFVLLVVVMLCVSRLTCYLQGRRDRDPVVVMFTHLHMPSCILVRC